MEERILKIRDYFLSSKETIAIAESVTSGLVQFFFSTIPDAGKFYHGGITAYNLGQKYKHLNVEPIHAQDCNCVSADVAMQMALNVCTLFKSNWGIGITGYATPVPESGNRLFAHYAIVCNGTVKASGEIKAGEGEPEDVQTFYKDEIINHFTKLVAKS